MSAASSSRADRPNPAAVVFGCAGVSLEVANAASSPMPIRSALSCSSATAGTHTGPRPGIGAPRQRGPGRRAGPDRPGGGRVQRLGPPAWRRRTAWRGFGDMAADRGLGPAIEAARVNAREMAGDSSISGST